MFEPLNLVLLAMIGAWLAFKFLLPVARRVMNRTARPDADSLSLPRVDAGVFFGKAVTWTGIVLVVLAISFVAIVAAGVIESIFGSISSCTQSISKMPESLANVDIEASFEGGGKRDIPVPTDSIQPPLISRANIVKWLNEARIVPSDNGWEQVPMIGTHHSRGKYGLEFITNCSLLGDCVIEIKALAGRSGLTSLGPRIFNGDILLFDQEKPLRDENRREDKEIIEYTASAQKIEVTAAQLLYLWRRPSENDEYRNVPLDFTWKLVENRSKEVVRKAFKKDFRPKAGHEELCDFTMLPFQLPAPDGGVPIRTQFDICITFTKLTSNNAAPSPKPEQDLLDALPSVIKMVTVVEDKKDERVIFSDEYVVANIWGKSSEEIRDRWLNVDEYKMGKLIVAVRQPLTMHITYCVRGER